MNSQHPKIRIDKWLFYARVAKTRSISQKILKDKKVRVNNQRVITPSHLVGQGDVVTVTGKAIRVLRITQTGNRRGPATEAATLYQDLSPPKLTKSEKMAEVMSPFKRPQGTGRPTKKERRMIDKVRMG